jgi:hypothetical protein
MTKTIPSFPLAAFIGISLAALALGGCAGTGNLMGGAPAKPKTIVVSDFAASTEVDAVDRGFSVRMDRKDPNFPLLERKRRTLARVNDEIVATIIATLREAGLDAEPGSQESISLKEDAVLITGSLRPASLADLAKKKKIGFGSGYGSVAADMTLWLYASGGKKQLLAFAAQVHGKAPAVSRKEAAARNAAIDAALGAEGTAAVKLSPETEVQARALGRTIADKIVAFAREQSWLTGAGAGAAAPEIVPAEAGDKPVRIPPSRPVAKPAQVKPVRQITPQPMPKSKSEPKPEPEPEPEPEPDKQGN